MSRKKYNLNALSHDTAIDLIRKVESKGIKIAHVYIDTVGPPVPYKTKIQKLFPGINVTVTEKADSKYPIVSAASVCAKVMRDRIVQNWKYPEADSLHLDAFEYGSGYPTDPKTQQFLTRSMDPVFGYPTLARFSWSTITNALEKGGCKCDWNEPKDDGLDQEILNKQQNMMRAYMVKKGETQATTKARTVADKFFEDRMLSNVTKLEWS